MKIQKVLLTLVFVSLLATPFFASAFVDAKIIRALENVGLAAAEIVAVVCGVMIIFGGFVILTSSGSPDKVAQGRQIILWAAVGLAVVLLAMALGGTFRAIIG